MLMEHGEETFRCRLGLCHYGNLMGTHRRRAISAWKRRLPSLVTSGCLRSLTPLSAPQLRVTTRQASTTSSRPPKQQAGDPETPRSLPGSATHIPDTSLPIGTRFPCPPGGKRPANHKFATAATSTATARASPRLRRPQAPPSTHATHLTPPSTAIDVIATEPSRHYGAYAHLGFWPQEVSSTRTAV